MLQKKIKKHSEPLNIHFIMEHKDWFVFKQLLLACRYENKDIMNCMTHGSHYYSLRTRVERQCLVYIITLLSLINLVMAY